MAASTFAAVPSFLHEVLVEMFRDRPELVAELLAGPLGIPVPAFRSARVLPGELTDVVPTEYRADAVVTFVDGDKPLLGVVVEAQLRVDARKRRSWPAYVATLYARLGCPVVLLVVCPEPAVATWCAVPIFVGEPGFVLTPVVLGPDRVPVVTDAALARRSPEMALLSVLAHGGRPGPTALFEAFLAALAVLDHDHARLYTDVVFEVLPAAARNGLEALMSTTTRPLRSEFLRRIEAEGRAKGEAKALLAVLDARGIDVPEEARERITGCTDIDQLDTWIRRAATASTVDDLFD